MSQFISLTLDGGDRIQANPHSITHFQARVVGNQTLLWFDKDNMPTVIDEPYLEVATKVNEALADQSALELASMHDDWAKHAADLITAIRKLQWAFGLAALGFIILLLVIIGRFAS